LYNRRGFFALAEHQLRVAARENSNLILVYLDLNNMKSINDEFGHKEGDRALTDTANILRKSFRESDVLGRLGGDEFAILLMEPSDLDIEQIIYEHIQQNLKSHNEQNGRQYLLSVSTGIAHYDPANPCTLDDLLTTADKMMYREKGHLEPEG
jgi:diguanylate cyclase (GGDEF)-like protein